MVGSVCGASQPVHQVAVRLIEALLFELLYNHTALHPEYVRVERKGQHAVALGPEGGFDIMGGYLGVEVGEVVRGPGIVVASGGLNGLGIVGHVGRTAKHQVFEQVRNAGKPARFVARTYVV